MYQVYHVGDIVTNNQGIRFVITFIYKADNHTRFKVKSVQSGYIADVCRSALYNGRYKDNLSTNNSLGICIGYASNTGKYYRTWYSIWKRCYDVNSKAYKWYGADGVRVCDRWRRLDYFIKDCQEIPGFNEDKFFNGDIQLDKDTYGKKLYSKETCVFISRERNHNTTRRNKPFYIIKNGKKLEMFSIVKCCAKKYHLDDSCICKCLKGERSQHKGYKFKYVCNANDYRKG